MENEIKLNDGDWEYVFAYAKFEMRDIAEIIGGVNGMNDESDWVGLFRLKDGRFGAVKAGCDYTGWG